MLGKMLYKTSICIALIAIQVVTSTQATNLKFTPVNLNHECAEKSGDVQSESPIILIHGMGMTLQNWDGVYETLVFKSKRKVCRVDLRNHGNSPWSNEVSVGAMSDDIVHLLDEIGAKKAILVGHSLGGKVAMNTALNYGERVESVVIEDITPNLTAPDEEMVMFYWKIQKLAMDKVPKGSDKTEAKKSVVAYVKHLMQQMQATINDQKYFIPPYTCSKEKCHWLMNVDDILEVVEKDFLKFWTPSVGIYEGPALFMYGTESPFKVPDHEEDIKKLFPKANLVPFEGAGHGIHGYFPDFENEILKLIGEFCYLSSGNCATTDNS